MKFRSVTYRKIPGVIARINRNTSDLILNPEAWSLLEDGHKNFVLLHEEGHYILKSDNEFQANDYALGKFLKVGEFTDAEFKNKVEVLADILENEQVETEDPRAPFSNFAVSAIAGAVGTIFGALPAIGVGAKSRQKEQERLAKIEAQATANKTKSTLAIAGVIGFLLLIGLVLFFKLKKR